MKISNSKIFLYIAIVCLIYFSLLVYWEYNPPASTGLIQFIGELITIPLLLFLIFSIIYSLIQAFKKGSDRTYIIVFICNLITVLFFTLA